MIAKFLSGLLGDCPCYLRVNRDRVELRNVATGEHFRVTAKVGFDGDGKVVSVDDASGPPPVRVSMPFQHPRVLIDDFSAGEQVFRHAFRKLMAGKFLAVAPVVLVHPDLELDGGLSPIEARALQEMAEGAGARKVYIHYGRQLSDQEVAAVIKGQSGVPADRR